MENHHNHGNSSFAIFISNDMHKFQISFNLLGEYDSDIFNIISI